MAALLELKNFGYSYGNINVARGINLYVDEGEIVTIIGANGAGKTTTLRAISGLLDQKGVQGEIWFDGKQIQSIGGHKITEMGLSQVLEGRHVFSKLTVMENLMIGAYVRKDTRNIKEDLKGIFKLFPRLEERKVQLAGTLSGGEQQMLAIARALIAKPKMMLLDEPSLGLAPLIVKEIFETIERIRAEGMTILFVEQNSKIALATAQRGYVFATGEVVLHDECANLLENEDVQRHYLGVENE